MGKPVDIPAPPAADCHGRTPTNDCSAAMDMPRESRSPAKKSLVTRAASVRTANRHRSARINVLR